jgi:hypothetical protein
MKEAPGSSETSVITRATRCNNPEDTILHSHRSENLKSNSITFNIRWDCGTGNIKSISMQKASWKFCFRLLKALFIKVNSGTQSLVNKLHWAKPFLSSSQLWSYSRSSEQFMVHNSSLLCSQELSNCPYPKSVQFNILSYLHIIHSPISRYS